MKLIKWLKNCSGKIALTGLQTAGLATVVGVAGIGAYSFLSAPEEEPAFSPSSYNPGEVVYVAGAPSTQQTREQATFAPGESPVRNKPSSVRVTARTLNRLEQEAQREKAWTEMEEYQADNQYAAPSVGAAYSGGDSEGLGMGANVANEMKLNGMQGDPMAAVSGMMGNMKGMMDQVQQQAQHAADQAAGKAAPGKADTPAAQMLKSANMAGGAKGSSGGGGFNSTFAIQNSGKNRTKQEGAAASEASNVFATAQEQLAAVQRGGRIGARASFGPSDQLDDSKDVGVMNLANTKEGKDMKWMSQRSNKVALNKNRSANEAAAPFLASNRQSGGMRIEADSVVSTGGGQGSKDFEAGAAGSLRGLGAWGMQADEKAKQRKKDYDHIRELVWWVLPIAFAGIPWIADLAWLGRHSLSATTRAVCRAAAWVSYGIVAVAAAYLIAECASFASKWGGAAVSTWGGIVGGIVEAYAFIAVKGSTSARLALAAMRAELSVVGVLLGLGAAWMFDSMTADPMIENPGLTNVRVDASQRR